MKKRIIGVSLLAIISAPLFGAEAPKTISFMNAYRQTVEMLKKTTNMLPSEPAKTVKQTLLSFPAGKPFLQAYQEAVKKNPTQAGAVAAKKDLLTLPSDYNEQ